LKKMIYDAVFCWKIQKIFNIFRQFVFQYQISWHRKYVDISDRRHFYSNLTQNILYYKMWINNMGLKCIYLMKTNSTKNLYLCLYVQVTPTLAISALESIQICPLKIFFSAVPGAECWLPRSRIFANLTKLA
jgi:hypothetical protein